MNKRQAAALGSLRAVQLFLTENRDRLPTAFPSGARLRLDETISELAEHTTSQTGDRMVAIGLTKRQTAMRRTLIRKHIAPIVRIAKAQGIDAPELTPMRMPRGVPGLQRLVDQANAIADAAEPFRPHFVALGLANDFADRLRQATRDLVAAVSERNKAFATSVGATSGLGDRLKFARRLVAVLDAFVTTDLQDDASRLAAWQLVKHVPRAPRRRELTELPVTNPNRLLPAPNELLVVPDSGRTLGDILPDRQ